MALHLTTPWTKSEAVGKLQTALAGDNVWKKNFRPGKKDKTYGPGTAGAVERAKWYMGYPAKFCDGGVAGATFLALLSGKKKLPPMYALRRKQRLAAAAIQSEADKLRLKALNLALGEEGETEHPPNSNKSKYSIWYGVVGPWCAMFVTWCYVKAGSTVFKRGSKWAYCPYVLAAMYQNGSGITRTAEPQPGDIVLYSWNRDSEPEHIGKFIKWLDKRKGTFLAIEGNTAVGNDSNGGKVMKRDRDKSQVVAFGTVHA